MKSFKDKVVVITGGATGIGFGLAKAFGKEGAKVVIASRREKVVNESVEKLKALDIEAAGTTCDVADYDQVERLADFAWKTFKRVDVLVNNAGVTQSQCNVFDLERSEVEKVINVNYYGVLNGIQIFGKRFINQGTPCAIYNVGSENSLFNGVPQLFSYISAKHAVHGLTTALREDAPDFMDVALICTGYVASEMTAQMGGGMDTDKYAAIVLEQLKQGEFYIVSHAHNIVRINNVYDELKSAYEKYAPRYEGDIEFDVRTIAESFGANLV